MKMYCIFIAIVFPIALAFDIQAQNINPLAIGEDITVEKLFSLVNIKD